MLAQLGYTAFAVDICGKGKPPEQVAAFKKEMADLGAT